FDGTNDYVALPTTDASFSSGFTFAVWARPTTAGTCTRFFDIGTGGGTHNVYLTRYNTGTTVELGVYNGASGTTYKYVRASNAIVLNEWHHYAATIDS